MVAFQGMGEKQASALYVFIANTQNQGALIYLHDLQNTAISVYSSMADSEPGVQQVDIDLRMLSNRPVQWPIQSFCGKGGMWKGV